MASPFPGMDPFLEASAHWPAFRHHFVGCLHQVILPGLIDRYRARVAEYRYAVEQVLFTSIQREEHAEPYVEIRRRSDSRLVTVLTLISPAQRTLTQAREGYQRFRRDARSQGANLVEIDLVLQGTPVVDLSRQALPEWDYALPVTRAAKPDAPEVYTTTLSRRLPRFAVPLQGDERDCALDLQAVLGRAYDAGRFISEIDYRADPPGRLTDANARWLNAVLTQAKLRP